jgi:hypothetical protein
MGKKASSSTKKNAKAGGQCRSTGVSACVDVDSLFRGQTVLEIQTTFSQSLRRWAEGLLGVRLPEAYVALLKKRNGGRLRMNAFKPRRRPKEWSDTKVYDFDRISGIDRNHHDSITELAKIAGREWGVPEGLIPIDGDGHWWLCLDYRRCGPEGEPSLTNYDTEYEDGFPVAKSFDELLAGLVFGTEEHVFGVDFQELPGKQLHQQLVDLGCKEKYPRGTKKGGCDRPAERWTWAEYGGASGGAALLYLRENDEVDPWTVARPTKHPLLVLDVCEKHQQRCVSRLVRAFGNSLPLLHQPAGRRAIRGLPEYPPFQSRASSRKSQAEGPGKFRPAALNGAVLHNNIALVKDLLKRGARPDKPPVPNGVTALEIAAGHNQTEIFKLLLEYAKRRPTSQTLTRAVAAGHLRMTKIIVEQGLQPNEKDLMLAILHRHESLVHYVLSLGIRPTPKAVRRAAGFADERVPDDLPHELHRPILRMIKKAGIEAPDARVKEIFDTL